eukprot:15481462-Alexandrium_andersonii.AAC.1
MAVATDKSQRVCCSWRVIDSHRCIVAWRTLGSAASPSSRCTTFGRLSVRLSSCCPVMRS